MRLFMIDPPDIGNKIAVARNVFSFPPDYKQNALYGVCTDDGLENVICNSCKKVVERKRRGPVRIYLYGEDPQDFIWGDCPTFIVLQKVLDILRENCVSGLQYSIVEVEGYHYPPATENIISGDQCSFELYAIDVIGKEIPISEKSVFEYYTGKPLKNIKVECSKCEACGKYSWDFGTDHLTRIAKAVVEINQWDGSDCFRIRSIGPVFTEKVVDLLIDHKIRNWQAVELNYTEC